MRPTTPGKGRWYHQKPARGVGEAIFPSAFILIWIHQLELTSLPHTNTDPGKCLLGIPAPGACIRFGSLVACSGGGLRGGELPAGNSVELRREKVASLGSLSLASSDTGVRGSRLRRSSVSHWASPTGIHLIRSHPVEWEWESYRHREWGRTAAVSGSRTHRR